MDLLLDRLLAVRLGMIARRNLMDLGIAALLGAAANAQTPAGAGTVRKLKDQSLPSVNLQGWVAHFLEVHYGPGESSHAHKHPGFVMGYVLEGEIRFQVRGGPEQRLRAGEIFYESPGSVHQVSANASATKPARILAMVFAPQGSTLTTPA
ncbi:MAG TPA: cupin domain-containing protein [Bryobacteraceae bacterium]|nr:cupin domain-containing protein [Bryobacteraceae bacterium]